MSLINGGKRKKNKYITFNKNGKTTNLVCQKQKQERERERLAYIRCYVAILQRVVQLHQTVFGFFNLP